MKTIYYVDLPNPNKTSDDDAWVNYNIYFSKKAALKVLKDEWGIKEKEAKVFITKGEA